MIKPNISPVPNKSFGAVITDVDLTNLTTDDFVFIQQNFLKFGFLVFPRQFLSDQENIAWGALWQARIWC